MSTIIARSVASLYGWKPNLRNGSILKRFLYKFLGGWSITKTIRYNFGVFWWKMYFSL